MSGLSRKIQRNKVKAGKARPAASKLDALNRREAQAARLRGDKHYQHLSATKGYARATA